MNVYKNAKYALVIGEPAEIGSVVDPQRNWRVFSANLSNRVPLTEPVLRIHDNVWLIPLNTHMLTLVQLVQWANANPVRLRILFLDEVPDWIQYQPAENPAAPSRL